MGVEAPGLEGLGLEGLGFEEIGFVEVGFENLFDDSGLAVADSSVAVAVAVAVAWVGVALWGVGPAVGLTATTGLADSESGLAWGCSG